MSTQEIKQAAQERFNEYKGTVVEMTDKFVGEVEDRAAGLRKSLNEAVAHPYDTIDQARDGLDSGLAQTKDKVETEASIVVGYKDQFLGSVKEAFGRVLRDQELLRSGVQQRLRGEAEVGLQKSLAEEKREQKMREAIVETLMCREALLAQLAQQGGYEKRAAKMRHVEVRERNPADLFIAAGGKTTFALKSYSKGQLLDDIRNRRTRKPMLFVNVRERGLMRSIPLQKKDLKFKGRQLYTDLWASIRRSDPQRLHHVERALIRDRSQPRVDLLRSLAGVEAQRAKVLKEVKTNAVRPNLVHTETDDKTKVLLEEQKQQHQKKLDKGKEKDNGAGVFGTFLSQVRAGF
jgi:uncharacterized protein YjbJ (UPF0337 family)